MLSSSLQEFKFHVDGQSVMSMAFMSAHADGIDVRDQRTNMQAPLLFIHLVLFLAILRQLEQHVSADVGLFCIKACKCRA